jgi:hypothetical protein
MMEREHPKARVQDHPALPIYFVRVAVNPSQRARLRLQKRNHHFRQMIRVPHIILVQQGYKISRGMLDAQIPRRRLPTIRLLDELYGS